MAGNGRRGAVRKVSKKNVDGSGGQKCGLRSKGLIPKAEDRVYHAAHKRANEKCRHDSRRYERRGDDTELVAGHNPVVECLHAKVPAAALIVALGTDNDERLQESVRIANSRGIPTREVLRHGLDAMTGNTMYQGISLQVLSYKYSSAEDLINSVAKTGEPGLIVCLDNITDSRNLGAVIRSVATFGDHGVVIPERRSAVITGVVQRTSAGTIACLPVARVTGMVRSLKQLQKVGYQIIGLDAGGDHTLDIYDGTTPVVAVVGSRGKGPSRLVRDTCSIVMSTSMTGWVKLLNASVAASVALSEFARQHRAKSSQQRI